MKEFNQGKLAELAFIDDLTGLYNRRYLKTEVSERLLRAKQSGESISFFMIDVDHFKGINDTYGHLTGDHFLAELAKIFKQYTREEDILVRYAGDEFIIILPGKALEESRQIAGRLLENIEKFEFKTADDKNTLHATLSLGIALYPKDGVTVTELISSADRALYSSKEAGRNRISTAHDISRKAQEESRLKELFPTQQFINRINELDLARRSKFIIFSGESGIGKSRLLAQLGNELESTRLVLKIYGTRRGKEQPYHSLSLTLENYFKTFTDQEIVKVLGSLSSTELTMIKTQIKFLDKMPLESAPIDKIPDQDRTQGLFQAFSNILIKLCKDEKVLLLVDNLESLDIASLEVTNFLLESKAEQLSAIFALSDDADALDKIKKIIDNPEVNNIKLAGFDNTQILETMNALFPGLRTEGGLISMIQSKTRGNILYIEEILRHLVDSKKIYPEADTWQQAEIIPSDIPNTLEDIFAERFKSLDAEELETLNSACVLGENFNFNVLRKLSNKNAGYIYDLIDRLEKARLITPHPDDPDRYIFASRSLHDQIYKLIEENKKKDMHLKSGKVQEELFQDRIANFAGEISYHYRAAGEVLKADQLLSYTRLFFEEQNLVGMLDKLKEQKKFVYRHLKKEEFPFASDVIRSLRSAVVNLQLYPSSSEMVKELVKESCKILSSLLEKVDILAITEAEKLLFVNGKELGEKESKRAFAIGFVPIMTERRLKSIAFQKGIREEELFQLLVILSKKHEDIQEEGGAREILKKAGALHIEVEELVLEDASGAGAKEKINLPESGGGDINDFFSGKRSLKGADFKNIFAQLQTNPQEIARSLVSVCSAPGAGNQEVARNISNAIERLATQVSRVSPEEWGEYSKALGNVLVALDPKLLPPVLEHIIPPPDETTSPMNSLLTSLPDQKFLESVNQLLDEKAGINSLRKVITGFLKDPNRRIRLEPELKIRLGNAGYNPESVDWICQSNPWLKLSNEEKANKLLKAPPELFLEVQKKEKLDVLIRQLINNNRLDLVKALLVKLTDYFDDADAIMRQALATNLRAALGVLLELSCFEALNELDEILINQLSKEDDPPIVGIMVDIIAQIGIGYIKKSKYKAASGIIAGLKRELKKDADKEKISLSVIDRIASPEVASLLKEELKKSAGTVYRDIAEVMIEIGAKGINSLIDILLEEDLADPFKSFSLRGIITMVTSNSPDDLVTEALKSKLTSNRNDIIKNAIEMLGYVAKVDIIPELEKIAQSNPDLKIVVARATNRIRKNAE